VENDKKLEEVKEVISIDESDSNEMTDEDIEEDKVN
jgi:hypothetical protein